MKKTFLKAKSILKKIKMGVSSPHSLFASETNVNSQKVKRKKILICLAESGNGHRSVAEALKQSIEKQYSKQYQVKIMDVFYEAGVPPYSEADLVHSLVTRLAIAEKIQILICRFLDTQLGQIIHDDLWLPRTYRGVKKILDQENADLLISVHWLASEIFQMYFKDNPAQKFAVVLTDFENIIRPWYAQAADLTVCGSEETAEKAIRLGVSEEKIMKPYFPLRVQLQKFESRERLFNKIALDPKVPTVLISFGGLGGLLMRQKIYELLKNVENIQIIVLTGRVDVLYRDLADKFGDNPRVKILGFIDNMQDYLANVDLIIGKPGANSILEAMLFEQKMILTKPIGDQEIGNLKFALTNPNFMNAGQSTELMKEYTKKTLEDWTYEDYLARIEKVKNKLDDKSLTGHNQINRSFYEAEEITKELISII